MRWLLFLSRVALLCNIFFLIALVLQTGNWIRNEDVVSLVLILGFFLSGIINPIVNLLYLLLKLFGKRQIPVGNWLILLNFFFLILQVIYVLYLNEVHRHAGLEKLLHKWSL